MLWASPDTVSGPQRTAGSQLVRLKIGPGHYVHLKDPCPVRFRGRWHLYGTGVTAPDCFEVLRATSRALDGPWRLHSPIRLPSSLKGACLAAPGMIVEGSAVHMFLQTEYAALGGRIEHLLSYDDGLSFEHCDSALEPCAASSEAGVYDPHPAKLNGDCYLIYAGFTTVGEPNIHLAISDSRSWAGPWRPLGPVLSHEEVPFHNRRGSSSYEWGLEGPQLLELPGGKILLIATCFLRWGEPGARQRAFAAVASQPQGPYTPIGPLLEPPSGGENGHATAHVEGNRLAVVLQERKGATEPWRYTLLRRPLEALLLPTGLQRGAFVTLATALGSTGMDLSASTMV